jgi:hypothetical protein
VLERLAASEGEAKYINAWSVLVYRTVEWPENTPAMRYTNDAGCPESIDGTRHRLSATTMWLSAAEADQLLDFDEDKGVFLVPER